MDEGIKNSGNRIKARQTMIFKLYIQMFVIERVVNNRFENMKFSESGRIRREVEKNLFNEDLIRCHDQINIYHYTSILSRNSLH